MPDQMPAVANDLKSMRVKVVVIACVIDIFIVECLRIFDVSKGSLMKCGGTYANKHLKIIFEAPHPL